MYSIAKDSPGLFLEELSSKLYQKGRDTEFSPLSRERLCIGWTAESGQWPHEHTLPVACRKLHACLSATYLPRHMKASCWCAGHGRGAHGRAGGRCPCQHSSPCTCWQQCELPPEPHLSPVPSPSCNSWDSATTNSKRLRTSNQNQIAPRRFL